MNGERFVIGVMIGNANSPHTQNLMDGIHQAAIREDVDVLYFLGVHSAYYSHAYFGDGLSENYDYQSNIVYDYASLEKIDALIIDYGSLVIYNNVKKNDFLERFRHIPQVLLEDTDESGKRSVIINDNYNGMKQIVTHLIREHKCRSFTYLSGPPNNTDSDQRRQAFLDTLKEYDIPFDMSRMETGDFTDCVDKQAARLLDSFPDTDALICANDMMASSVYRECEKRGLVPGRDLAVTGYDDWTNAFSMDPPLTTVFQNSFEMGVRAVMSAVSLCRKEPPRTITTSASLWIRESCGCRSSRTGMDDDRLSGALSQSEIRKTAESFVDKFLLSNTFEEIRDSIITKLAAVLSCDLTLDLNREGMIKLVKELVSPEMLPHISPHVLAETLNSYIDSLIARYFSSGCQDAALALVHLKKSIRSIILIRIINQENLEYDTYRQESWFLPLIANDMLNSIADEKEFYRSSMLRLHSLGLKASFLCLLDEPVVHRPQDPWKAPGEVYLASFSKDGRIRAYEYHERPVFSGKNGLFSFFDDGQRHSLCLFCLFSGEIHYGLLATEIDPSRFSLVYLICGQISNMIRYQSMYEQHERTQRRLEKLVGEVNEKNKLLNYTSEYDSLTGILNRRGFMHQAQDTILSHPGSLVYLMIADLDHLKEINDTFGHAAGDHAIKTCALLLKKCMGEHAFAGRIGGDEFTVLSICSEADDAASIRKHFKEEFEAYNQTSDKDYYVTVSVGIEIFRCDDSFDFSTVLRRADDKLYRDKQQRRKTVRK